MFPLNKISLCISGLFFCSVVYAQNNTSPYSSLGIGDVETSWNNRYTGMGNAAVAMSDRLSINNANAASLPELADKYFIMELSGRWKGISYQGAGLTAPYNSTADIAIKRANIGFKINKLWGSSVGLQPFTTANYSYKALKNIEGTDSYLSQVSEGSGGVNQFYWANGVRLNKHTSLGLTTSFLFGSLAQTESLVDNEGTTSLYTKKNVYLRNYYLNASLQDKRKLGDHWTSVIGVTYSPQTSLLKETTDQLYNSSDVLLKESALTNDRFKLPTMLNTGIAFISRNQTTYTINNNYQNWSDINYKGVGYHLVNSSKWSVGYQHSRKAKNYFGETFEQHVVQLGAYGGKTYLQVDGHALYDYGISAGYGKTLPQSGLGIYGAIEVGQRKSNELNLLNETYLNINFTFSYRSVWFKKTKYY